jgi:DNA-binding transcriptional MerR regulator
MEYSINKLAKLTGISTRALRYYDEIGLLKPKRINRSGYRIYGQREVDLLHHILLYREMDMPLAEIKRIVLSKNFDAKEGKINDRKSTLENHLAELYNSGTASTIGPRWPAAAVGMSYRLLDKDVLAVCQLNLRTGLQRYRGLRRVDH